MAHLRVGVIVRSGATVDGGDGGASAKRRSRGGFGALQYPDVLGQVYNQIAETGSFDPKHPPFFLLHSDGDNHGGGADSPAGWFAAFAVLSAGVSFGPLVLWWSRRGAAITDARPLR